MYMYNTTDMHEGEGCFLVHLVMVVCTVRTVASRVVVMRRITRWFVVECAPMVVFSKGHYVTSLPLHRIVSLQSCSGYVTGLAAVLFVDGWG